MVYVVNLSQAKFHLLKTIFAMGIYYLFVGLSETWLQSHNTAEPAIDGYTPFHSDTIRKRKGGGRLTGGVAFYVRNDKASSFEIIFSHSSECVQLMCLYSSSENLAIMVIYLQPDDKHHGHPSTPIDFTTPINRVKNLLCSMSPILCLGETSISPM